MALVDSYRDYLKNNLAYSQYFPTISSNMFSGTPEQELAEYHRQREEYANKLAPLYAQDQGQIADNLLFGFDNAYTNFATLSNSPAFVYSLEKAKSGDLNLLNPGLPENVAGSKDGGFYNPYNNLSNPFQMKLWGLMINPQTGTFDTNVTAQQLSSELNAELVNAQSQMGSQSFIDKTIDFGIPALATYMMGNAIAGSSLFGGSPTATTGTEAAVGSTSMAPGAGAYIPPATVTTEALAPSAAGGMLEGATAATSPYSLAGMSGSTGIGLTGTGFGTSPLTAATAGVPIGAGIGGGMGAAAIPTGFGTGALTVAALPTVLGSGGGLFGGAPLGGAPLGGAATSGTSAGYAPEWLKSISNATGIPIGMLSSLGSTALSGLGSYLQGKSATEAARTSANAQIEAARIAAEAAKFRPVGVTTRFGQSQFGYDPATGNLTSAGYTLSPEIKAQQDALMGVSNQTLQQYQGAMGATAPLGAAATGLFGLGQGYLGTTPQAQAQKYMAEQQALLAAPRANQLSDIRALQQAQGRGGLAIGGNAGQMATNPEMAAYYNALQQQDLGLAAQATQGGMDYAKFGAGLYGAGGDLLKQQYGTQTAAYAPYQTALGGATSLEGLGQQPMDLGTSIGAKTSTSGAQAGLLAAQGMQNAAQTMQPANAYNPWVRPLGMLGNVLGTYQWGQ